MDLFLIIIRNWVFGKIGYGVRKTYFFLIKKDDETPEKKRRKNADGNHFADEFIGFMVLMLILALAQYLI